MVARCANIGCSSAFHHLEQGRVFRLEKVEKNARKNVLDKKFEYFWLCPACSTSLTLSLNPDGSVRVEPAPHVVTSSRAKYGFVTLERIPAAVLSWLPPRRSAFHECR